MASPIPLSGLGASVTLPPGITANIYDAQLQEEFREKNSEAFTDNGYGNGTLTGQRLHGSVVGWLTGNDPGIGSVHPNVAIVFTAAAGCTISGNFNITGFRIRLRVGQVSLFTADISSLGPYRKVWLNS